MKQITSADDIKSLGTIMGIWAHPDDETFTSGGLFSTAVKNGQTVIIVTATKGEQGIQDESRWPSSKLANIRAAELTTALELMGINEHKWLGYADGTCKDVSEAEVVSKLRQLIDYYKPDTIITFGPDGLTGHDDHKTVSHWVQKATEVYDDIQIFQVAQLREKYEKMKAADDKFNIFFNTAEPALFNPTDCDIVFELPADALHLKYLCLEAMPSQMERMLKAFSEEAFCQMIGTETYKQSRSISGDPSV